MSNSDGLGEGNYRGRYLGPFADLVCWFKGHEWRPSNIRGLHECARCRGLSKSYKVASSAE